MRKISKGELDTLLLTNVCEIFFIRRRPERTLRDNKISRRMLCTNSFELLNSINGKASLNYRPPVGPKKVDEVKHNLVVTWDIFMQDYRNVSMDACFLINQMPADDTFWTYYNETLYPMSAEEKSYFMDSV